MRIDKPTNAAASHEIVQGRIDRRTSSRNASVLLDRLPIQTMIDKVRNSIRNLGPKKKGTDPNTRSGDSATNKELRIDERWQCRRRNGEKS